MISYSINNRLYMNCDVININNNVKITENNWNFNFFLFKVYK